MKFTIRDAKPEDSNKLIELTSLAPMKGIIGLRIDRKPDFFRLLNLSESYILLVAEDNIQQIIGCFAATKHSMCIDGKTSIVYYLRDLKIHPDYKGSILGYKLVKTMYNRLLKANADILCCTMAAENDAVLPFFSGRANIPAFTEVSKYKVYQLLPSYYSKLSNKVNTTGNSKLASCFADYFKKYSLRPSEVALVELKDCIHFTSGTNNIDAAIAAFDPFPYKQNVVTHYSLSIATLLTMLKILKRILKLPSLPKKFVPLKIIYAKYYAYTPHKEQSLKNVIQQLRHYAFSQDYHLVAIAADEKDEELNRLLKPLSRFVFKSSLLATTLKNNEELLCKMKQGICYEDYSLA